MILLITCQYLLGKKCRVLSGNRSVPAAVTVTVTGTLITGSGPRSPVTSHWPYFGLGIWRLKSQVQNVASGDVGAGLAPSRSERFPVERLQADVLKKVLHLVDSTNGCRTRSASGELGRQLGCKFAEQRKGFGQLHRCRQRRAETRWQKARPHRWRRLPGGEQQGIFIVSFRMGQTPRRVSDVLLDELVELYFPGSVDWNGGRSSAVQSRCSGLRTNSSSANMGFPFYIRLFIYCRPRQGL